MRVSQTTNIKERRPVDPDARRTRNENDEAADYTGVIRRVFRYVVCGLSVFAFLETAQSQERIPWKTGPALERQLKQSQISLTWAGNPLRNALERLSQNQQVAIFLDRRVDPGKLVEFTAEGVELGRLLPGLADYLRLGLGRIGPVQYFGPAGEAEKLATIVALREQEVRRLPAAVQAKFFRKRSWSWEELSTPKSLLEELAEQANLKIGHLDNTPHDLWPAVSLPEMTLIERLSLVLAGFGMTFEITAQNGSQIQIAAIPKTVAFQKEYPLRGAPSGAANAIRERFPKAQVKVQGGRLAVVGSWEDHQKIAQLLQGNAPPQPAPKPMGGGEEVRYSLKIENQPVGGVAQALAKRLGRKIEFAPQVQESLGQLVSFQVKDETLDGLLQALLKPAGMTYQMNETTLKIGPAP